MKALVERLRREQASCVVESSDGVVQSFHQRGVMDFFRLLEEQPEALQGARVADKVVGRAAAALMICGGVKRLHTFVVSNLALVLLQRHGVETTFEQEVPHIINRSRSGWCPLEERLREETDVAACVAQIRDFLQAQ